jgi:hypothetical protein
MSKLKLIALGAVLALVAALMGQQAYISHVKAERDTYKSNTSALLGQANYYKVYLHDSLHAASMPEVSLRLAEYERYRAQDAADIAKLRLDKRRIQQVTTAKFRTSYHIDAPVKYIDANTVDSLGYGDGGIGRSRGGQGISPLPTPELASIPCINVIDPWYELHGCIINGRFVGNNISFQALDYVEHIIPHRFLFFKWGTKERRQEILSKNPYTRILACEFITIRK